MPIQQLPDAVASQIAAGEVIERPASVVKELLENSLDAGARQISIAIESAGRRLIEVADDGSGIPPDELRLAVARHSTSKLISAEDLFHIKTLGFRGEALASIGSVARLTLTSRIKANPLGARLTVDAGHIDRVEQIGAPYGSLVRVEDLFFNVPARLKFLKQDSTERQQIDVLVTRYALAYPKVQFKLTQEGRLSLQSSGNGDRREVLANLYGLETSRQMLEVVAEEDDLNLTGFISPISLSRSNRREITFFVNGRWVQNGSLTSAILQAYHTFLMVGRFPMAVLFVEMASENLDVNVHPAKAEVRFRSSDRVFSSLQRAVRRALLAYSPVPIISPTTWTTGLGSEYGNPTWNNPGDSQTFPDQPSAQTQDDFQELQQYTALPVDKLPLLRLVGQIGAKYLVAEGPDGLYLIDQHAAHERVLFERFMRLRPQHIPAQSLLEPVLVQLSSYSSQLLTPQLPFLEPLGFQVEPFGVNTFIVRAIPALIVGSDPEMALRALVEDFEEDESPLQHEVETRIIARVCKRAAVKGGQNLSLEEQRALVRDLEACRAPRTCPHGRPTMIHLSVDLLEKQFGRKGSR
jgi:DNA mismatch repair protein MutL